MHNAPLRAHAQSGVSLPAAAAAAAAVAATHRNSDSRSCSFLMAWLRVMYCTAFPAFPRFCFLPMVAAWLRAGVVWSSSSHCCCCGHTRERLRQALPVDGLTGLPEDVKKEAVGV